jgi:hypothetical protein
MGLPSRRSLKSGTELLGRDTGGTRTRADEAESQKNVQHAYTADSAAKRRMKDDSAERMKVDEKKVLFPEGGPREIEKQGSHLEANNDQQRAEDTVHS